MTDLWEPYVQIDSPFTGESLDPDGEWSSINGWTVDGRGISVISLSSDHPQQTCAHEVGHATLYFFNRDLFSAPPMQNDPPLAPSEVDHTPAKIPGLMNGPDGPNAENFVSQEIKILRGYKYLYAGN